METLKSKAAVLNVLKHGTALCYYTEREGMVLVSKTDKSVTTRVAEETRNELISLGLITTYHNRKDLSHTFYKITSKGMEYYREC